MLRVHCSRNQCSLQEGMRHCNAANPLLSSRAAAESHFLSLIALAYAHRTGFRPARFTAATLPPARIPFRVRRAPRLMRGLATAPARSSLRRGVCDCLRAATRQGHPTVSQNYPHFVAGLSGTLRRSLPLTERLDTLRPLVRYRFAKARLLQTKRCGVNMPDKEEGQLAVVAYATNFLRGPSIRRVATS